MSDKQRDGVVQVICPFCERLFSFDELPEVHYVATEGGRSKPSDESGPAEYYSAGTITCPHCGHLIEWENT